MSTGAGIMILDADGVFLSERPYWNAALAAAFDLSGLSVRAAGRWERIADHAFGPVGLQRVAKRRGCNSNWDLAAVLVRGLGDRASRSAIGELLDAGRELEAMRALAVAAQATWRQRDRRAGAGDPLLEFGIDRDAESFREVVERFQARLHGEGDPAWSFERIGLRDPGRESAEALASLAERGFELRVCTGRHRAEILEPIRELGLESLLDERAVTSADDVDRAQARSGRGALGKPHWFAPACSLLGYDRALRMVDEDAPLAAAESSPSAVYLGDAWADFAAVERARALGLRLEFVHVRSGVTTAEQDREIRDAAATSATVASLAEFARASVTEAR